MAVVTALRLLLSGALLFAPWLRAEIAATITVDASKPQGPEIPQTIFGTFLEPIGHSIYGGLWAQIIENPSFEENLWNAAAIRDMITADPDLIRGSALGLPLPWEPLDPTQGNRYEPRWGDAANSGRSLLVMGLPGREAGVRQKVYLPVHRILRYNGAVWLKTAGGTQADVDISLRKRAPAAVLTHNAIRVASGEWKKYEFALELPPAAVRPLEAVDLVIALPGDARVFVDQVSLYPADAVDGMDPEMIAMSRALHTPVLRFGGNFTSAYHWRDGIGPLDQRVSMLNIAWGMPEYNQFGTDEFLDFCRRIGAQPQIALNLGTGTPEEAAGWVRYVNQKWNEGRGGLLWELGNELWGDWQVGYPLVEEIAARTTAFSKAVRAVDPGARLIATGQDPDVYEQWNAELLNKAPDAFDYLSTHFVVGSENIVRSSPSPEFAAEAEFALPMGLETRLRAMARQFADYRWARGRVKTAFTEWLFWAPDHSRLARFDNMGGAVCTGGFLNMLLRLDGIVPISDMTGLIEFGGIWKKKGRVFGVPAYYVFRMYAPTEPRRLVHTRTNVAEYDVHEGNRRIPDIERVPWLDVVGALDESGSHLYLYCVNRSLTDAVTAKIGISGFASANAASVSTLRAAGIYDGNNEEQPEAILPVVSSEPAGDGMRHTFPPASVTVIALSK
jgi:alpha-N-arabinofuranosidase